MNYDVIVVGSGTGGTIASKAISKLGLSTCLIDQKKSNMIGNKICGDAIEKDNVVKSGIEYPRGKEIENTFKSINIYLPDDRIKIPIKREGYIVNRLLFGQRLLRESIDAGVEFHDQTMILKPIFSRGFVVGVEAKDMKRNEKKTFMGKVIIDASGYHSRLRNAMKSPYIEPTIDKNDAFISYREILKTDGMDHDPSSCHFYLRQGKAFLSWIFPRSHDCMNVGVSLVSTSNENIKNCYKKFIERVALPNNKNPVTVIHRGGV